MTTYDIDRAIAKYQKLHHCSFKEAASAVMEQILTDLAMTKIKTRIETIQKERNS